MTCSIFHFFKSLFENKHLLSQVTNLERDFPFDKSLLSYKSSSESKEGGKFPDMAIRICIDNPLFSGGELIEVKDSKSYAISSFNSTIPSGKKFVSKIFKGQKSSIKAQMIEAGDDVFSLDEREVFYLLRGKKNEKCKVVLVNESFFETVKVNDLIAKSFSQVLEERLEQSGKVIDEQTRKLLQSIFSEQENFSKVRDVEKASVKLRFRVMTEAKAEGNIFNASKYPEILDNTLNFLLPCDSIEENILITTKMSAVFDETELKQFNIFSIKHHFNGHFLVFQIPL